MLDCGSASGLLVAFYVCFFLLKFESKVMRNFQNDTEMAMIIGPDVEPLRVLVFLLKNRNQEFDDKKLQSQLYFQFSYSIATNCRMMFVTNLYSEKPFKDMTKIQPSLYSLQQYHLVL